MSEKQNKGLLFILITICIDCIGLGIIIPSLPSLIADATHLSVTESSKYSGIVLATYALMQFLFSPLIGNLSDRYGRRPIILMSLLGLGLDYVFMYFAPSLAWLIFGRAVSGMFGASFTTAAAYIADISTDENRARNFGLIGAAFGAGFIIGPAIGGVAATFGIRTPFMVAACLSLVNFIYGLVFLKESLPESDRREFDLKRANPIGAIKQIVHFPKYRGLFVVTFIVLLSNMAIHSVWNYYTMARYGWDEQRVGISLAVVGVCFGVVQAALSGPIVKKLGEKGAATLGLVILSVVTVGIGLIPYGWMMYLIILPYAFAGIVDPSIRSLVSGQVKNNEQGELQGIFTSLMSLAEMTGPLFMMWIFYKSVPLAKENPVFYGSPFFVAAALAVVALIILRYVFSKIEFKANEALLDEPETDDSTQVSAEI